MKTGMRAHGFTIVEVIIVMAVTAALLASALALFSGKQAAVEFNQASNDIQSQVNQVIDNVNAGYYTRPANFTCMKNGPDTAPTITTASQDIGTNADCIFLGRVIQFGVGTNDARFNIYNLAGLHYDPGTTDTVSSLANASPIALAPGTATNTSFPTTFTEIDTLEYGLKVVSVQYNGSAANLTGMVAFVTNINGAPAIGSSSSDAASLYIIKNGNTLNQPADAAVEDIDQLNAANFVPASSVTVCFDGGTSLYAVLTIGNNNRQLTTSLQVLNKSSSPSECS